MIRAIILLSGGLDSALMLALALEKGLEVHALSFDYGQRHRIELEAAQTLCLHYNVTHQIIKIDSQALGSSLLVGSRPIPQFNDRAEITDLPVPATYVPARNTLFLAYATMQAEIRGAEEIHFGPNAEDSSYPDCRKAFIRAQQNLLNVATQQALEGHAPRLVTPLIAWDKARIVQEARRVNLPIELTWTCYDPQQADTGFKACGTCLACTLRQQALRTVK